MNDLNMVREAIRLRGHGTAVGCFFVRQMAREYGCHPVEGDGDNLMDFLCDIYVPGRRNGIRAERARRRAVRP